MTARNDVRRLARESAMAGDLAAALDPVRLALRAGIEPDGWQADVLRSTAPRILLNCCRQSGKSTTTALLGVHTALYAPGALVLLLSPTLRQSGELFRKCRSLYGALGRPIRASEETQLTLTLANGSRIVSLPGQEQTVRGYSGAALIAIDEAARVPSELVASARPMLAVSGGRLIALSTPYGARGWWFEAWEHGGADWERYDVPATACPRIPAAFLEEERRTLGPWWFSQEYECRFMDSQTSVFSRAEVDRMFAEPVEVWNV